MSQRIAVDHGWRNVDKIAKVWQGVEFANETCVTPVNHPKRAAKLRLASVVPVELTTAFAELQRALFWHAASRTVFITDPLQFFNRDGDIFGAKSQDALTRVLLTLQPRDIRYLTNWARQQKDGTSILVDWLKNYRGAISVARVAHALLKDGQTVIMPTSHLDTCNKIDLIVVLHTRPAA